SLYIYGHLNGVDGLQPNTAIFVGELGGERTGQAKVFHPIQDLSGKSPAQIASDLRAWFPQEDPITDFNAFFQRAALHVKRNNLVLAPLNVVLFSDGEPDYPGAGRLSVEEKYKRVDLSPLEFLSRNVTVRLLYADPPVAQLWERRVPRKRVRIWTQDSQVMRGGRGHMLEGVPLQRRDSLWRCVAQSVVVRVRRAAQPHTEFTTTRVVDFAPASATSTSSGVRSSPNPMRVSSSRIGWTRRGSYIETFKFAMTE